MSLFAIGDLHLSFDSEVAKPMDVFGGPWVQHWETLEGHWRELVGEEDTVLIPGDISWAMRLSQAVADLTWIEALPGKKVLLKGNHDLWWSSLTKMRARFPSLFFLQNNCYEGEDFIIAGSRGWTCPGDRGFSEETDRKIYERERIRLDLSVEEALAARKRALEAGQEKTLIGTMHFPPMNDRKLPSDYSKTFVQAGFSKVIYGHLHGEAGFAKGPEGVWEGVEYLLCSFDKLEGKPRLILP